VWPFNNITMDELTTFINNTDSEHEFFKTGKISNVRCVSRGSHVPDCTPLLQKNKLAEHAPAEHTAYYRVGGVGRTGFC
jgi:hypothetical protein